MFSHIGLAFIITTYEKTQFGNRMEGLRIFYIMHKMGRSNFDHKKPHIGSVVKVKKMGHVVVTSILSGHGPKMDTI
jgi:hypothetical protein